MRIVKQRLKMRRCGLDRGNIYSNLFFNRVDLINFSLVLIVSVVIIYCINFRRSINDCGPRQLMLEMLRTEYSIDGLVIFATCIFAQNLGGLHLVY